jgi:hypothetical protein
LESSCNMVSLMLIKKRTIKNNEIHNNEQ